MNKSRLSILLAGLLAVAGAQAQTAAATSSVPVKPGEASTQAQGQPNVDPNSPSAPGAHAYPSTAYPSTSQSTTAYPATTTAPGVPVYPSAQATPRTRDEVRQEARGMGAPAATTPVPGRAGEASTMVHGRPNVDPNAPVLPPPVYNRIGVPATLPDNSPSVFQGGTPQ